ncbi:streptosactin export ABC transporter GggC [Streptococcus himalayensis]|uniref:ABC transporter ATP-binding protein n=1 Tax=Streptococcus himalayensis TaxID=1888195 RepID=A0A917A6W1_9STRE|nr:ABC transporter ATP-binding protein [Streptococcus himalayensis]GGE30669.1 ABC transporter ATP-binding protein [Streptococcus himalayensis]
MLSKWISKKYLILYVSFIAITWLEAIINPSLISLIVASFEKASLDDLWRALAIGIVGNFVILTGLAGKRYYYARIVADFTLNMKGKLFGHFLYDKNIRKSDILSELENDVKQLENDYLEPSLIILSSIGFTTVSVIYALLTNFWLGLIFIFFYSIPALCSGIGSQKLNQLSKDKANSNQDYLAQVTNIIGGERVIKNYSASDFFFARFKDALSKRVSQDIHYEKQRTVNNMLINSIDAFCSVVPIIIGGIMTYQGSLSGSSFVAIYLVAYNIGYQFNELSYYLNTYKSTQQLRDKYEFLLEGDATASILKTSQPLFPIIVNNVNLTVGDKKLFHQLSFTVERGEKIAIIGPSGCGKTTVLNMIYGDILPDSGEVTFSHQQVEKDHLSQSIAYILQESYGFDGFSLEENIALGQPIEESKMNEVLSAVNLLALKNQLIHANQLSGGEKQRLEIARSLYHDSQLILADEVKSNLDKENASQISEILLSIPSTLIEVIHHYDDETLARYDKVIDLSLWDSSDL